MNLLDLFKKKYSRQHPRNARLSLQKELSAKVGHHVDVDHINDDDMERFYGVWITSAEDDDLQLLMKILAEPIADAMNKHFGVHAEIVSKETSIVGNKIYFTVRLVYRA